MNAPQYLLAFTILLVSHLIATEQVFFVVPFFPLISYYSMKFEKSAFWFWLSTVFLNEPEPFVAVCVG